MKVLTQAVARDENPTEKLRKMAWDNVAYTNYIQGSVGVVGDRPTRAMWKAAKAGLAEVFNDLQPRNVIVIGKMMWQTDNFPDAQVHLTDDVQGYRLENGKIAMCWAVTHTRAGLTWQRLANVISFAQDRTIAINQP